MLFFKKKKKVKNVPFRLEPELALELLPYALARGNQSEPSLLRTVLSHLNIRDVKRILIAVVGGSAAVSLLGKLARDRFYRATVSRELKKQLAPLNKKLDELEKQNEELKKQNEQLKKQLR